MRRGESVRLGAHTLICADVRDVESPADSAVLFDPPYDDRDLCAVRWPCPDALVLTDERRLLAYAEGWPRFRCAMIWDPRANTYITGGPLMRARFCLWFGDSPYTMCGAHWGEPMHFERPIVRRGRWGQYAATPCGNGKHLSTVYEEPRGRHMIRYEKPVTWLRLLIGSCTTAPIFDPFAGSGAALIACEQLGRASVHVEIDPNRCEQIVERWERHQEAQRAAAG
jgi:hypothetical protein